MSVADCGWGMMFARNAQEAGDFCLIARKTAEATNTPFFNVQDGFLTTHTVETVRLPEPEFMKEFIGSPKDKLTNLMDPTNPMMSGVVQNQDSYMKGKIAQRWYYDRIPASSGRSLRRVRQEDRPALRLPRTLSLRGCRLHHCRHGLLHGDGQGHGRLPPREEGNQGWLSDRVRVPARSPRREIVDVLKDCHALTVLERMDDPLSTTGNHLTREIKAAFCDAIDRAERAGEDRPRAANLPRGRGPRQSRRAAGRHYRRLQQHDARRPGLLLRRHRSPVGPEAQRKTPTCGRRAVSRCVATRSAASAA